MSLRSYQENQNNKSPTGERWTKSGVGCPERNCSGEMMILKPNQVHPELQNLKRAVCGECGWKGWV